VNLKPVCLVLALVALVAGVAGCTLPPVGSSKAGGAPARVVLRMANVNSDLFASAPAAGEFIRRVSALSGGQIQIRVIDQLGSFAADNEVQVVRAVASGDVDLGLTGSRVFDSMGVSSFRALSAPMLIDSYPLEKAVIESSIPGQMLGELQKVHVTGLGVFGNGLRMPVGVHRPLLAPQDWQGISFGTYRSVTQEIAIRALGATRVVEASGELRRHDLTAGRMQGFEFDVRAYSQQESYMSHTAPYITANEILWPQVDVLVANPGRLASLSSQQRTWLGDAATDAARDSVGLVSQDSTYISQECAAGTRFANATQADLTEMQTMFASVYETLERDPQTSSFIRQLQSLKSSTPPGPPLVIPPGCSVDG
jgi:TRAP-type transport system periplasmic protein